VNLPTRFEGPDESPGFLLWQVTNAWQRAIREALAPLGLTHVQFVLLASIAWLAGEDRPPTQRALAAHARTDEMMTSQVVRALEARGLIERAPHPEDARARILRPTPQGRALAQRAIPAVEAADEAFFAALGTSERRFLKGLKSLSRATSGQASAASPQPARSSTPSA
jgi:MarR family transcriptional regulator, organic hydroperoxide resistance regulator